MQYNMLHSGSVTNFLFQTVMGFPRRWGPQVQHRPESMALMPEPQLPGRRLCRTKYTRCHFMEIGIKPFPKDAVIAPELMATIATTLFRQKPEGRIHEADDSSREDKAAQT